jgi:4'-phosphopantetheinyl transferase
MESASEVAPRAVAGDEAHIWKADLTAVYHRLEDLLPSLSASESARAARFHFERDRRRFIAARSILRDLLGRYLGEPPAALVFREAEFGKPYLTGRHEGSDLRFNLSHTRDFAVYAVTRGREVGIDVEAIDRRVDYRELASRFFAASEAEKLFRLPDEQQPAAFFRCWTRKEALVKAVGAGLSIPLDSFEVSFLPGENVRKIRGADGWTLMALELPEGFAGAVVAAGEDWTVREFTWPG